jgi:60 kDa SS-A/Ro ribonucleoprotein
MRRFVNLFKRRTAIKPSATPDTGITPVNTGNYKLEQDEWDKLDTFLLLGKETVMYYAIDHDLTQEKVVSVQRCIHSDGLRAVRRIVEISEAERAPNNDPALFALALAAADHQECTRKATLEALPRVARSDEQIHIFTNFVKSMDGLSRDLFQDIIDWSKSRHAKQPVGEVINNHPHPAPVNTGSSEFELDDWGRLDIFLLLGSETDTYYAGEHDLRQEKTDSVRSCIQSDGKRAVKRIVEICESGRAPKNDPALFALALAVADSQTETRIAALEALPRVARSGVHLFIFLKYVSGMRGWGRSLHHAIANWYRAKPAEELIDEAIQYQLRGSWTHRDVLRLAHVQPRNDVESAIYRWITQGWMEIDQEAPSEDAQRKIWAYEKLKVVETDIEAARLINGYQLALEIIPPKWFASPKVWEALLPHMCFTAVLDNLGPMTASGMLSKGSEATRAIKLQLASAESLKAAQMHPLTILNALRHYELGCFRKGSLLWTPLIDLVDAIDQAFYQSLRNVAPLGKRLMLAIDVSNSMNDRIPGMYLSAREAAVALALIATNIEPASLITVFASRGRNKILLGSGKYYFTENGISEFDISPNQRLEEIIDGMSRLPFARTDFCFPMLYAMKNELKIDLFCIYTDYDEMVLSISPSDAIQEYRQHSGITAALAVVKMVSNRNDRRYVNELGGLDVVGFDPATPQAIDVFARL